MSANPDREGGVAQRAPAPAAAPAAIESAPPPLAAVPGYIDHLGRADVTTRAAAVARLQRGSGNQALQRALVGRATLARDETDELRSVAWAQQVQAGPQAPGVARVEHSPYLLDTIRIEAALDGCEAADVEYLAEDSESAFAVDAYAEGSKLVFEARPMKAGDHQLYLSVMRGSYEETYTVDVTARMDRADLVESLSQASTAVTARYEAAEGNVLLAAQASDQAVTKHNEAVGRVEKALKARDDLIWAAFFAAAGGAAGGAAGAFLKRKVADLALSAGREAAVTDSGKDLVKFIVRTGATLRGGGAPTTPGDSTAPSADPGGGGTAPVDQTPFQFLTGLAGDLKMEKSSLLTQIEMLQGDARAARGREAEIVITEDPAAMVQDSSELTLYASELSIEYRDYLRVLWQHWLAASASTAVANPGRAGTTYEVRDNLGDDMVAAIKAAAAECGDDGQAWIDEYAPTAQRAAEEQVEEGNKKFREELWWPF